MPIAEPMTHEGEDDVPMWVCRFPAGETGSWGTHWHRQHQIAWVAEGMGTAVIATERWTVAPTRAVWIPGGLDHDLLLRHDAVLLCLYVWPQHCPLGWAEPRELAITTLARELLLGLAEPGMEAPVSHACATVLFDQFRRRSQTTPTLPMPADERASDLAEALLERPASPLTLDQWARRLAVSQSTLRRAFVAETGLTFSEWRTRARLDAAAGLLAEGVSVGRAARRVGYVSRSGFVDAFRRQFGHPPSMYGAPGDRSPADGDDERAAVEPER